MSKQKAQKTKQCCNVVNRFVWMELFQNCTSRFFFFNYCEDLNRISSMQVAVTNAPKRDCVIQMQCIKKNQPGKGPRPGSEGCCTNDGLSSTKSLRKSSDLGVGVKRTWWLQLLQLGLLHPTFIAIIGQGLPQIPGHDVRDHGAVCSLLIYIY